MIFLTVGTQFSFDRLVKAVDKAVEAGRITESICAQTGRGRYRPHNFDTTLSLEKGLFDKYMRQARYIIGHAGMGTIATALSNNKPLLVMPREKKFGEVVSDHQIAIAKKFEEAGYLLVAYHEHEFPEKIEQLKTFMPRRRIANPQAVAERVKTFLNNVSK